MTTLVFDIDWILYDYAAIAEQKFIIATHIPTGEQMEFENRTQLWGHHKKKSGGWIAEQNKAAGEVIYLADEFSVTEGQRLRSFQFEGRMVSPLNGAKRLLDNRIKEIVKSLGATSYCGFTGEGEVFRHKVATLMPYKGQRTAMLRPLLLKELKQHVIDKHNIKLVTEVEADDAVSWTVHQGYENWKKNGKKDEDKVVGLAIDKDSKGVQGFWHNPKKDAEGVVRDTSGFGSLYLDAKGEVDGHGRMWLYFQICSEDTADNYCANAQSEVKWGAKGAYNALKDCKNDKEAWQVLVDVFKKLYPEPKEIQTFRGDVITIDAMYVLQEMTTLAHMLRRPLPDSIDVKAVLNKLGIKYE